MSSAAVDCGIGNTLPAAGVWETRELFLRHECEAGDGHAEAFEAGASQGGTGGDDARAYVKDRLWDRFRRRLLPCGHRSVVPSSADPAANLIQSKGPRQLHGLSAAQPLKETGSPISEEGAEVIRERSGVDGPPSNQVVSVDRGEVQVFELPLVLTFRKQFGVTVTV
jgi:hypothetical protein